VVSEIIGREEELALVHAFIGEADGEPAALVLEGEAGIGKSTLWLAGVEHARAQGLRVLASRPAEAERGLAHMGLADLFEDILDDVLPALPAPRRRALEVALLMEELAGDPVDPRAVALGVRGALQLLSGAEPLLVAVDDVQWLDPSSASALGFALRRLASNHLLLLFARRLVDGAQPSGIEHALDAGRVQRVHVGPLSVGALHRFLHDRLGRPFARQTLLRIHERSGGNPFFALELARVVDADFDAAHPLPVPETLEGLVRGRIAALPARTREALAFASALGTPAESLLERAGVAADALAPAISARVIERENGVIRFTHPLLSSVLYGDLREERWSVHRRLAEIVDDPLVRAHHLALARDAPDAATAAALDDATRLATDRGASAEAAQLAEHALRLTPPENRDELRRRELAAARANQAAGEWTRARTLAADLLADVEIGPLRAEALVLLAEFEIDDLAVPLLEEAVREASSRPTLELLIRIRLAWATRFRNGFPAALEDARAALLLADELADAALQVEVLTALGVLGSLVGDPESSAYAARAHRLATAARDARLLLEANVVRAQVLIQWGRLDAARERLAAVYDEWRERDELFSAFVLWNLSWVELWDGHWELAADYAGGARDISLQYAVEKIQDYLPLVWIAVHRGQFDLAHEQCERGLELSEQQLGFPGCHFLAVLGLISLWSGDAAAAADLLGQADLQAATLGWGEPSARPWSAEYAEALLELGRFDDATRVIEAWEADAQRLGRERVLAAVTRCRGLVAAANGNVADAISVLRQAVVQHEEVRDRFGRARALLALGVVYRRARQKRAAREAIEAALAGFEQLGAATWVEKARAELGSISGRSREDGLTAAERRVATLVAEGRTNREVAAALFLAERTVAGHLTHIYAKLGVRSRSELARQLR
jgi:DNA-binding CsgD family transcriptional regulator